MADEVNDAIPAEALLDERAAPADHGTNAAPGSPLIDVKAFAALLGCSTKHVRRMADAGRCPPPIRLGGLIRWHRKIVGDWIDAGCPTVRHVRMNHRG
jgi:prophage regulatory protein